LSALRKSRVDTSCRPRKSNLSWPGYSLLLALAISLALVGCARQYNDFGAAADIKAVDLGHGDTADLMSDSAPDGKNGEVDIGASDADVIAPSDSDATLPIDSLDTNDPDLEDTPDLAIQDTPAIDLPESETAAPVDVIETVDTPEVVEVVEIVEPDLIVECGDDQCTGSETCESCAADCGLCPYCGDSSCDPGESCDNCLQDCECPGEEVCFEETCCKLQCAGKECGSDSCGGVCGSCPADKTCESGKCGEETMALVPASNFWMGCNSFLDDQCDQDESPQHSVDVPEFYIDITQVSVKRYAECVEYGPCEAPNQPLLSCYWDKEGLELHPMNCVTWEEASIFCEWAEKRLCTEAEWEKAARGGCDLHAGICSEVMPKYPWGDAPVSCAYANYHVGDAGCGSGHTLEVDSVLLGNSPYGTLHMVGNLWDWVEDCYHSSYEDAPANGSAWTTNCADGWSLRGGSFWSTAAGVRSSSRHPGDVLGGFTVHTVGIRCCKDP
jgi:formylglycine-generating enzyme